MPDINSITDEEELHKLLHATDNFDERRKIRSRLKELREAAASKYQEKKQFEAKKSSEKVESAVEMRKRQAEQEKARKLAQFDKQAAEKSAKPDLAEEYVKQKHAQAEKEKEEKLKKMTEMGGALASGYNVRAEDIAPKSQKHDMTVTKTEKVGDDVVQTTVTQSVRGGKDGALTTEKKETATMHSRGGVQYGVKKAPAAAHPKAGGRGAANMFKQMDKSNAPEGGAKPNFLSPGGRGRGRGGGVGVQRSPSAIKEMLLNWCRAMTKEYENVEIKNFSGSWNDGMAFCALIHHFYPNAFDFTKLNPKNRRGNFKLAFDVAEKEADICPLLDVDDMVHMQNPDWKCVFTYVQSLYKGLQCKQ